MNDMERRRYNMLVRVRDFGAENAGDFPASSVGGANFAVVGTVIGELEQSGAAQMSGAAQQSTTQKAAARAGLREDLQAINRTANALALDNAGLDDKFRMPRGDNDQTLLAAARTFLAEAAPHKKDFTDYGLPADFLTELQADIEAFEQAATDKSTATGARVEATAAIDAAIQTGMTAVKKLDAVVSNKYRDDAGKLAAWTSVSHVERAPRADLPSATPPVNP